MPRLNPAKHAEALAKQHGLEDAVSLAHEIAAGAKNALDRKEGREVMEFMTPQEVKKTAGFWSSVAGYLTKKLEKSGAHRAVDRLVS